MYLRGKTGELIFLSDWNETRWVGAINIWHMTLKASREKDRHILFLTETNAHFSFSSVHLQMTIIRWRRFKGLTFDADPR